jgi:hypothetical protein
MLYSLEVLREPSVEVEAERMVEVVMGAVGRDSPGLV